MDQSTLVENQIDEGRRFIEQFAADNGRVQAAFWAKTTEEGLWFLYLASELIDHEGPAAAYRAVQSSLGKLGESWVSSSEVKVVSPRNPVAKDVLTIMTRHPGRLATRFGGRTLGSIAVEDVYIYPSTVFTFTKVSPMTKEEVGREILRLMNRGPGVWKSSRVTMKDGTAFSGVPFSFQFDSQNAVIVSFVADGEAAPRVVRLDEVASIAGPT